MELYGLKSDQGYLKLGENNSYTLVGLNKASVYPESEIKKLQEINNEINNELLNLRIIQMTITEKDFFA
jgi:hypothetical protein